MQVNSKTFRELQSIQLDDCITSIDICVDFLAVGCLDDKVFVWENKLPNFVKEARFSSSGASMGVIDLAFNKKATRLAVSYLDSTIKVYELESFQPTTIECNVMQNWKVQFLQDNVMTAGELGRLTMFDPTSKERTRKCDLGDIFLTSIAQANNINLLAAGNNNGDLYIVNSVGNKDKIANLKPHHKLLRELAFFDDDCKLMTASDDGSIKIVDVSSEKIVNILQGHKQGVSGVDPHHSDPRIFFSCSFDKTIKAWDLRTKTCVGTAITGSPLWDIKSFGKHLLAGGENGVLNIYSIE